MRIYVGIGSNLGDRQANVLAALQRLRTRAEVLAVSSFYETSPADGAAGPGFLNVAAQLETALEPAEFERFVAGVQSAVGRRNARKLDARPIDVDVLWTPNFVHDRLAQRPYNFIPLAEIAPELREPQSGRTLAELAVAHTGNGVARLTRSLKFDTDRQSEAPEIPLALDRAGVSRVRRILVARMDGAPRHFNAEFSMVADLSLDRGGVHMSRFNELLEEAALDVLEHEDGRAGIEEIAATIARAIVQSQRAVRAEVRMRAEFALERWTPVSGKRGEETYTLVGIAHANASRVRRLIGVEAEGMTACPCAQAMVRENNLHELQQAGFSESDARRALDALPAATHNQRGRGSVLIGADDAHAPLLRAADLVEIVESAMSSETYDLLKRPDEFFIVNKAHHNPKFVEDVVRGILCGALDMYADFGDETFVQAEQVNYESIHKHDAFAQAHGTFGELRTELRTGDAAPRTDLSAWLTG